MTSKRNWTYIIAVTIVRAFMLGAAAISFTHIVATAHLLGLHGFQAITTPFAIDGFAALGMLGRSHRFAESTRRVGLRFAIAAGTLSLAANVYAGRTLGERIYGVIVVAAFVAAEQYADRMAPAEADGAAAAASAQAEADRVAAEAAAAQAVADRAAAAKRSEAARKAAATRRANAEAAAKAERAENRRIRAAARALEAQAA